MADASLFKKFAAQAKNVHLIIVFRLIPKANKMSELLSLFSLSLQLANLAPLFSQCVITGPLQLSHLQSFNTVNAPTGWEHG